MKKKILIICMGVIMLAFTACGGENTAEQGSAAPAENAVKESAVGTDKGVEREAEQAADLEEVKTAVVNALGEENYWPDTIAGPEKLEEEYDISSDMYDEYLAEISQTGANADTFLIIKAKDGKVEAVQGALNAYRDEKVDETMETPVVTGKVLASRIETFGNYVCFVQLGGDVSAALESGNDAVIVQCQYANELALEIMGQYLH